MSMKVIVLLILLTPFRALALTPEFDFEPNQVVQDIQSQEAIRSENKALVQEALDKLQLGQEILVNEVVESQCDGTSSKYKIKRDEQEFSLILNVHLTPIATDLEIQKKNLQQIQQFL